MFQLLCYLNISLSACRWSVPLEVLCAAIMRQRGNSGQPIQNSQALCACRRREEDARR